ncbi:FUSC family protein [Virgibacillus sediminis]|uniref:FUSC family protein n=2 Tax=Virgibacillus sediminis TaxID=202260 RepID=A0ABV7A8N4_9BACI
MAAADPGRTRFKSAGKATMSLLCSVLVTLLILHVAGNAYLTPAMIAGLVGMMGIVMVMDDTKNQKKVTTLLLGISAAAGMTIGSQLPEVYYIDIILILIIFGSYYFSKFGSRYFSIGQIGFMTIYFSSIMDLAPGELPWVYMGIAIGVVSAFLFNFILFQSSAQVLKSSMRSFHIQANLTFDLLIQGLEEKELDEARRKKIDQNVQKLRSYARTVAGNLNEQDVQELWPGLKQTRLRLYVFDAGMLMETLTEAIYGLKSADAFDIEELRRLLVWVMTALRDADVYSEEHHLEEAALAVEALRNVIREFMETGDSSKGWLFLIRRIESIANHIVAAGFSIRQHLQAGKDGEDPEEAEEEDVEQEKEEEDEKKELSPAAKKAFQALVASIIAIFVGKLISPVQPYWVLLTTFICLLGTESIGRTYRKGMQRSVGTIIGAVIGFLLAKLLGGSPQLELFLLVVVVFLSIYLFPVSYTWMSVFITILIAFMYDILLGGISFALIGERVIDTIAGALIAYVVSVFLFPTRTTDKVTEVSNDYLEELKPFVLSYVRRFREDVSVKGLTGSAIDIDTKLQQIEDQAQPLMKRTAARSHSRTSRWVTVFTAINYYARQLVASSYRKNFDYPAELEDTFRQVEEKLGNNIDTLSLLLKGEKGAVYSLEEERGQLERLVPGVNQEAHIDLIHHLYYVWQINKSIVRMSVELGAEKK